jgi:hypothetical protein
MAKGCAKCGRVYSDDLRVCHVCGIDLVRADIVSVPAPRVRKLLVPKSDDGPRYSRSGVRRDYFKEGYDFEVYVANRLLPSPDFEVEYFTTRRDDLAGRYIASALNPDIQIRHKKSGHLLWVECKWRTSQSIRNDKLAILSRAQLDRYHSFQEKEGRHRVYVVVGLDGRPNAPSRMFCIPLEGFNDHPWPFMKKLKPFERSPNEPFQYWYGRLK